MSLWFYVATIFISGMMVHRFVESVNQPFEDFRDFLRVVEHILEIFAFSFVFQTLYL